ncbi:MULTISPECIES: rhodanese-like domain-containing protein [Winogradskyella]|uniref:Rhodanese-like domain-containing protein n=1 Tax=Winogradskyella ouciana TaxID=2608631 RepID=A0A7K1GBR3_9FLAO|nr:MULTISPECIES: rhodanese-like domain-containing protein [Winogradskyella]MBO6879118.1 rhodanese-like domain-containing protein [Winogradskyella sp.]MTE26730.1 rhodanese-like domain-containing protein [Winogradskyella ouciana]
MKKIYLIFGLLLTLCFASSCLDTKDAATDVKLVTAEEMQSILEMEEVQLVDVRTPQEHEKEHIVNSQNIDFTSPTFDEDISKLDKAKPVILYCKGGNRSAKCAKKLKEAGFEKVYDLEGGISKWKHSDKIKIEVKS